VIDRATAKRLDRRYDAAPTMIADLERALAIETARLGDATGEANAVLRTLPAAARSRVPLYVRHPSSTLATALAVLLVLGAVAVFVFARVHRNTPPHNVPAPLIETPITLTGARATSYNPFARGGGPDNPAEASLAIDREPGTAWSTNRYDRGELNKPGVGIYVTLGAVSANLLILTTGTPGFSMEVWGSNRIDPVPGAKSLVALGWTKLGELSPVTRTAMIALDSGGAPYTHYLVWITRLEPGKAGMPVAAAVGNLELEHAVRR
jgi:hypothetical protein